MTPYDELTVLHGTQKQKKLAAQVAEFCKKKMFPRTERVVLEIHLIKDLMKNEGIAGDCFDEGERCYTIRVDKGLEKEYDKKYFIETLCHELVHVKQYAKSEMYQYTSKDGTRWHKKVYPEKTKYHERPWEVEAFAREKPLAMEFVYENLI